MSNEFTYSAADQEIKRDGPKTSYWLIIDIGSYRTTVICWPLSKSIDDPRDFKKYLIPFTRKGRRKGVTVYPKEEGFPSGLALIPSPSTTENEDNKFTTKLLFLNELDDASDSVNISIPSAKQSFAVNYIQDENLDCSKNTSKEFRLYIKSLLLNVFEQITIADPNDTVWNNNQIPNIAGIKVTIPDLFIDNLREGYTNAISCVCKELIENEKWGKIFNKSKWEDKNNPFVSITTDENGAGEVYFNRLLTRLSHVKLGNRKSKTRNIDNLINLFSSHPSYHKQEKSKLIYCRIDIGGLTTDASVTVVVAEIHKNEELNRNTEIVHTLKSKNSFSRKVAGQEFERLYSNNKDYSGNDIEWWDSVDFLNNEFSTELLLVIEQQYTSIIKHLEKDDIHGIYYIISGRPAQSEKVQETLSHLILSTFNKEKLILFKEACIFLSNFPYIWRNQDDDEVLRCKCDPDFSKLVTVLGNLYTLRSSEYEVDPEDVVFNIAERSEHALPEDAFSKLKSNDKDDLSLDKVKGVAHSLSKNEQVTVVYYNDDTDNHHDFIKLLTKIEDYPTIRIATIDTHDSSPSKWILPSIQIKGLDKLEEGEYNFCWKNTNAL